MYNYLCSMHVDCLFSIYLPSSWATVQNKVTRPMRPRFCQVIICNDAILEAGMELQAMKIYLTRPGRRAKVRDFEISDVYLQC
jgi:hypothetical protein